jgi:hypothetical protein
MLRSVASSHFEPAVESAYAVVVPSAKEAMAKRILGELGRSSGAGRGPPGPRKKPRTGKRMDIRDAAGNAYAVRSHELRHFLNNAAQEGRLSQLDIARWSGRKQVGENSTYDHTGGIPLARSMRELLKTDAMRGPIADTFEKLPAVERQSFLKSRLSTVHMTDIGACVQDWSLAPCPNHGSCAGCGDHLVIKGDAKQRKRAEMLLKDYEPMVAAAENEVQEGTYGASNWVEHNRKLVDGLKRVIEVHDDASIPDGTPVQATPDASSRSSRSGSST